MAHVLLIDDDQELCALLADYLPTQGFEVRAAHTGPAGLAAALKPSTDLVVLDVMLPGFDGFEVLRRLRPQSGVPVLMLTARGEDVDRIVGLEMGADDYLPKPFNPRELVARLRAILRRREPVSPSGALAIHGVELHPDARTVVCDAAPITLTSLEFDILERLMRAAGRVLSRDQLIQALYDRPATPYDRSIDVHISHLRRKLGRDRIQTIRGVGYVFPRP